MPLFLTGSAHSQDIILQTLVATDVYIYTYRLKMVRMHCLENRFVIQN